MRWVWQKFLEVVRPQTAKYRTEKKMVNWISCVQVTKGTILCWTKHILHSLISQERKVVSQTKLSNSSFHGKWASYGKIFWNLVCLFRKVILKRAGICSDVSIYILYKRLMAGENRIFPLNPIPGGQIVPQILKAQGMYQVITIL